MAKSEVVRLFSLEIPTPIGAMNIVTDEEARLRVALFEASEHDVRRYLRLQFARQEFTFEPVGDHNSLCDAITAYFDGDLHAIDTLPVFAGGTVFQREVWSALREIPCGATLSYGKLAERIGHPAAVRAVGLANGSNPVAVVVPCHRVIGSNGSLTGYGGGIERKQWLLRHEGARIQDNLF